MPYRHPGNIELSPYFFYLWYNIGLIKVRQKGVDLSSSSSSCDLLDL